MSYPGYNNNICTVSFHLDFETKFAKSFENFLSLIDCLITPKREGRVMGGFGVEIFLLTVSEVLEIMGDELGLTLDVEITLRTTAVGARNEQWELFCTETGVSSLE